VQQTCGPDGIAVVSPGRVAVWCSFSRSVAFAVFGDRDHDSTANVFAGEPLVASAYTPAQHDGLVLFHIANPGISQDGNLACASCHPDNRTDGLSWRIEKKELQTPILAGRVVG